jgi:hypothetical protein
MSSGLLSRVCTRPTSQSMWFAISSELVYLQLQLWSLEGVRKPGSAVE